MHRAQKKNRKVSEEKCLQILVNLREATAKEWGTHPSLGYYTVQDFYPKLQRIKEKYLEILMIKKRKNRLYFSIKEGVDLNKFLKLSSQPKIEIIIT